MVMDENGRNGWNWHLAQQLAQHVIIQKTTNHIQCNALYISTTSITCNHTHAIYNKNPHIILHGWKFSFIYNQIPIIIIYNLLTNRWLEYGIINLWT